MIAIGKKVRLLAVMMLCAALTVTAFPRSADAAKLYDVTFMMKLAELEYMPVNYFIAGTEMYYRLDSDKAGSTKTEVVFEYSKDNGKTWHFIKRAAENDSVWNIRFPRDPEASVVKIRTSVKFNPTVGKDTRSTIVTGPYKVYHLVPPSAGTAATLENGSIEISFNDENNAEDYYRITRTGDGQTVTYKVPSFNDKSERIVFIDKNTNTRKSTKYTYYIEPVFDTVLLSPAQVPTGLTVFGESKTSLLSGIKRLTSEQMNVGVNSTIKIPNYKSKLDEESDPELTLWITVPVVIKPQEGGGQPEGPTQAEIDEFNQLLDEAVAPASEWARNDIKAAAVLNLAGGEVLSNYQAPISRAHFAGLMVNLFEQYKGVAAPAAGESPFTDTSDPAVLKAYELGFVRGKTATTFDPYAEVTRQEIAVMLSRFSHLQGLYGLLPVSNYTPFADSREIADWAEIEVDYMAATGLLKGRGQGKFAPKSPMTREESIVLIKRVYDASLPFQ